MLCLLRAYAIPDTQPLALLPELLQAMPVLQTNESLQNCSVSKSDEVV